MRMDNKALENAANWPDTTKRNFLRQLDLRQTSRLPKLSSPDLNLLTLKVEYILSEGTVTMEDILSQETKSLRQKESLAGRKTYIRTSRRQRTVCSIQPYQQPTIHPFSSQSRKLLVCYTCSSRSLSFSKQRRSNNQRRTRSLTFLATTNHQKNSKRMHQKRLFNSCGYRYLNY